MASVSTNKTWEPIDFSIYFAFVRWKVVWFLAGELLLRWWSGQLGQGPLYEYQEIAVWIWRSLFFIFLAWRVWLNFGSSLAVAAMTGAMAGFWLGLGVALARFFQGVQVWKFFNLLTESFLAAAVGALILMISALFLKFKK